MEESKTKMKEGYVQLDAAPIALGEGEEIEGILTAITPGKFSPVLAFDRPDGSVTRIYAKAALKSKITRHYIGREFYIRCNGMVKTKSGQDCYDYDIGIKPIEVSPGSEPF